MDPPGSEEEDCLSDLEEPGDLQNQQKCDAGLHKARMIAARPEAGEYFIKDDLLYHRNGNDVEQVVIPHSRRQRVLETAHSSPMAAHLGKRKTADKILLWSVEAVLNANGQHDGHRPAPTDAGYRHTIFTNSDGLCRSIAKVQAWQQISTHVD